MNTPISAILVTLLFFAPAYSTFSQSITHSQYDGYSGERHIETSIVSLKEGFRTGFGVALRQQGRNYFLSFVGYGKKNTAISEEERLQFFLKDGTVIKFESRVQLPSNESNVPNLYIHHYYISKREIELLQSSPVLIVRILSGNSHTDVAVVKRHAKALVKLSSLFMREVNKFN